nr:hypothetical protein [Deinococcota bacterium]
IVPFAYTIATQGRVAVHSGDVYVTRSISHVVLYNLALLTGIMLPALMAYYLIWVRRLHVAFGPTRLHLGPIPLAVMLSLPIFATQVLTGVRYPLLLAAMGLFVVIYARRPLTLKTLRQLSLVGLLLLSVMVFMYQLRVYGVDSFEVETLTESLDFRGVVPSENVVAMMSRMADYFPYYGYQHGLEHRTILLFWIPRAVWPEKPTQLGYWFIRAYGITGFGAYHTTASSFADLAYADFGFAVGIALMLLLGMGLGLAERWTARIISLQGNPYIVMVAVLYGLTFFAVRQLSTVYFLLFGALAINLVFLALIKVRPKVVQEQASSAAYDPKHAMRQPLSGRG